MVRLRGRPSSRESESLASSLSALSGREATANPVPSREAPINSRRVQTPSALRSIAGLFLACEFCRLFMTDHPFLERPNDTPGQCKESYIIPTVALSVLSSGAPPDTTTVCAPAPICRRKSMRAICSTCSSTPSRTSSLKPPSPLSHCKRLAAAPERSNSRRGSW
jgi:hypothetical protein